MEDFKLTSPLIITKLLIILIIQVNYAKNKIKLSWMLLASSVGTILVNIR